MRIRTNTDYYKDTRKGSIVRLTTGNYVVHWGFEAAIGLIFALFVLEFIEGGSATHLGFSYLTYQLISALSAIPIGRFFDKHKGYSDEVYGLAISSFVTGLVYIAISFGSELWHLYVAMAILGFISNVNLNSWRIIFYHNISNDGYGETVGIFRTFTSIAYGLVYAIGGLVGDTYGFQNVVLLGGIGIFFAGFFPLIMKKYFKKK